MSKGELSGIEWVPMQWGAISADQAATIASRIPEGSKYLLGFNEPNFKSQSNLTPAQAAAMWPHVEDIAREKGLAAMSRDSLWKAYQEAAPIEFDTCARWDADGTPYRIIAPGKGEGVFNTGQKYADYFSAYLQQIGQGGATTNQVLRKRLSREPSFFRSGELSHVNRRV